MSDHPAAFRAIEGDKLFETVDGRNGFTGKAQQDYKWLDTTEVPTCTAEQSQEVLREVKSGSRMDFFDQKPPSAADACRWLITQILSFLRVLEWFPKLTKNKVYSDVIAGLTVGVMLIPQSMAYADIAGLQYIYGMYSGLMPTLVYAFMGTSNQLAVGPVAMVSLLTNAGLEGQLDHIPRCNIEGMKQYEACPVEYAKLAFILSLLSGIIQFGAGMCKAGFLVAFLGHPVVSGFTSGAAIIIGLSQTKYIMGYDIPKSQYVNVTLENLFGRIGDTNYLTFIFGVMWFAVLYSLKKAAKRFPNNKVLKLAKPLGPITMCVIGILIMEFSDLNSKMMDADKYYTRKEAEDHRLLAATNSSKKHYFIVGDIPTGFPSWSADWAIGDFSKLVVAAIGVSIIGFMESISIAKALASKHQYKLVPGQELLALGAANVVGACFSAYPVTGSFSRSAVNDSVGCQTPLSGMITAALMCLTVTVLSPIFYSLPKFCFAAIVINSVTNLFAWQEALHLWKVKKTDFLLWITAFLGTLFLGVMLGLGIAIALSIVIIIYESVFPQISVLWNVPGTNYFRNIKQPEPGIFIPGVLVMRLGGSLYFANVSYVRDHIVEQLEFFSKKISDVCYVVLDMTSVTTIDSSSIEEFEEMAGELKQRGILLAFANCGNRIKRTMEAAEFQEHIGAEWFLPETHLAVKYCVRHMAKPEAPEKTDVPVAFEKTEAELDNTDEKV